MNYNTVRSLELLQTGSQNPHAEFREGQEAAIQHLVESTQRLLVIQKQVGVKVLSILLLRNY